MRNGPSNLLTVKQAAEDLDVSHRTIQHWITSGKLAAFKVGDGRTSAYVIERDEIERVRATSRPAYTP